LATYAHVVGWGKYLPKKVITNHDIAASLDTSDEWIRSRTGISERRLASCNETATSMAIASAQLALEKAGLTPSVIDLIIVATATQEYRFPATACLVQHALGAINAGAYDLSAACSGFIYALTMGAAIIQSGLAKTVLVIGSETISRFLNERDSKTYPLFGDGAGALVLQADERPGGVLSTILGADGSRAEHLSLLSGNCKNNRPHQYLENIDDSCQTIKMDGPKIHRFAIQTIGRVTRQVCDKIGLNLEEISLFIPHQANMRIIESAFKQINISRDKVFTNLNKYGNTGAASIPIGLCEAIEEGRIQNKDKLVLIGFGGGLSWGATLVEWSVPTIPA
jgi:3-oxoacyl-[acyl-carrier-protein] synthase III